MIRRVAWTAVLLGSLLASPVLAQDVGGTVFEDRDGDGIRDAGEPALEGVSVRLFGRQDASGAFDETTLTSEDGAFLFSPTDGCYLLRPEDPPGWRLSQTREDGFLPSDPGYDLPVGMPRFSKLDHAIDHLTSDGIRYASVGDSIAWNFNICNYPESFWYSKQVRSRLACTAPGVSVTLDEAAIKGEHTDDLLVDEGGELNNVFRLLEAAPELITISMLGNDLLDVDPGPNPTPAEVNRAVAEVLDARRNLQEVLSVLVSELPATDVVLNTLYDNEAYNCYSGNPSLFHRTWIPIVSRILRDLAWGQARRLANAEVAAEFAHEDQLGGCTGFDGLICRDLFLFDTIHPTNPGFSVVREKVWEAAGGVTLGPGDAQNRSSIEEADFGYLRRVRRLLPTTWETRGGASVVDPEAALDDDDGGNPAEITLGAASEELRLGGFADWYDEINIVRVVAGVRYRTTGSVGDDFYRIEASVDGQFEPPPGFDYGPTAWNFHTPIVGGGGPNRPAENPDYPDARLLALPDVAAYRDVSALLTKNPVLPPGAADYEWPAVTHEELATATIRVVSAPVAGTVGNDAYEVELDHAWLDLYGWESPRPDELRELRVARLQDGDLEVSFESLETADRYNLYAGRIDTVRSGGYDHGTDGPIGPLCDATTQSAGVGRLRVGLAASSQPADDLYFLVTAHVDDVESPAGFTSAGAEIDRAESVCR